MIFWQHVLDKLIDNQKVYILTVVKNTGSSPGRKGFRMLVAQDHFIFGSIGGGIMEFNLVEEAKRLLLGKEQPVFIKNQIHRRNIQDGSGMICSGEQIVAFHCLSFHHIEIVERIIECLQKKENGKLILKPESFDFSKDDIANQFVSRIVSLTDWKFEEHIGRIQTIYIIGGGHVGVAVSKLLVEIGFYVVVFDNREELNTFENNFHAHEKLVVDYNAIADYILQNDQSYVAIMTNKYTDDKLVVSKLIRNKYKFIGVLGSKAKLKTMWRDLQKEGFTKRELDTLHAPIGFPIKSETPAEIAVSIAAQIIQVKNEI